MPSEPFLHERNDFKALVETVDSAVHVHYGEQTGFSCWFKNRVLI